MSEEKDSKSSLVRSTSRQLARYSNQLVRRGADLAARLHSEDKAYAQRRNSQHEPIEEKYAAVKALITIGKEKGYLLYDELNDLLPTEVDSPGELDELFDALGRAGIDVPPAEDKHRELDKTIAAYRKAAGLHPDLAIVHYMLGVVLQQKGQLDEASAAYGKAVFQPDWWPAIHELCASLDRKGQIDGAIAAFDRLIQNEPDDVRNHFALGFLLLRVGRTEEANREIVKACDLDPKLASRLANERPKR